MSGNDLEKMKVLRRWRKIVRLGQETSAARQSTSASGEQPSRRWITTAVRDDRPKRQQEWTPKGMTAPNRGALGKSARPPWRWHALEFGVSEGKWERRRCAVMAVDRTPAGRRRSGPTETDAVDWPEDQHTGCCGSPSGWGPEPSPATERR